MVTQDSREIIYVANSYGVLEFDGVSWQVTQLPHPNWSFSMAIDDDDLIYLGGRGYIGFLSPDCRGKLQYVSLSDQLSNNQKGGGIYLPDIVYKKQDLFQQPQVFVPVG